MNKEIKSGKKENGVYRNLSENDEVSPSKTRRRFIGDAAALGIAGAVGAGRFLSSCSSGETKYKLPVFNDIAPDGPLLKAGLIGCGGRGTAAAINFLNAGPNLQITALGDVFQDRIDRCRNLIKQQHNVEIPDQNCFVGFDAYRRVIESDVDIIIEASLAHFRPGHFEAAVKAGKHVFVEKPAGVDPVGIRSLMVSGKLAESSGLSVVAGTQYRHQRDYAETFSMIKNGAIGDLVSANSCYNTGATAFVKRLDNWSDMEYMIRNRHNWCWLTGDVIVNLFVHNLDILNWFFEKTPSGATGFGGRHRLLAGDMYDFFSVDYVFDDRRHFHGMCRMIGGCSNYVGQVIFGTKGYTNCQNKIFDYNGKSLWEYEYPVDKDGKPTDRVSVSPYDQEMIDLVTSIRNNKPVNEIHNLASSTLVAIMGRESAYTGKDITWEEMMNSDLRMGPEEYKLGPVSINPVPPIPGTATNI